VVGDLTLFLERRAAKSMLKDRKRRTNILIPQRASTVAKKSAVKNIKHKKQKTKKTKRTRKKKRKMKQKRV
jgi:hypothetical protein